MFNIDSMDLQKKIMIILVLIVMILGAYWQVQDYEFVTYDDPNYVTENYAIQSGITWQSIAYAFTDLRTSNWHPLTLMSHLLDWQMYRGKAGGHHWTSVIIHIFNTILLFLLLNQLTGAVWRSALVAALFAVHPINVESVAWIAERKNVLSTFFWLATMLFYVRYVKAPDWKSYLLVLICFTLGLMSKPMLVTLPFVLLLMDYWPLNRTVITTQNETDTGMKAQWSIKKAKISSLIAEKIPLFVLAAISSGVTVYAAKKAGAVAQIDFIPMMQRIDNALLSYVFYLKKLFWPMDLAVFYPHTEIHMQQLLPAVLLLVLITGIACKYGKKYPYLVVGWFWYLGTLVPVIGIVQVGMQSMADRYAYVPFIGIFIALSWAIAEVSRNRLFLLKIFSTIMFVICLSLSFTTCNQLKNWKNSHTLFEHAIKVTGRNFVTDINMGVELMRRNKIDEATEYFKTALRTQSGGQANYLAYMNLGEIFRLQNKKKEAIGAYQQALNSNYKSDFAYHRIGLVLFQTGQVDEAIAVYKKAIALDKKNPIYHGNLGKAYVRQGKFEEAANEYREVLLIQPDNADIHHRLALVLNRLGKTGEADYYYREFKRITSDYPIKKDK